MLVGAGDVDPSDGQVHIRFVIAPVLQNPAHATSQQPYYFVQVTNVSKRTALYSQLGVSGQPGIPFKSITLGNILYNYTDWQLIDVAPGAPALNVGDTVKLEIIAAGCQENAHFGHVYVDGVGTTIPGISVEGAAPAQANSGADFTYNFKYTNGGANPATGVVLTFNTPANTVFESVTSPAGANCSAPPVGTPGAVTCTFSNPIPAGSSGSYSVTVAVVGQTTGTIVQQNYFIKSDQETGRPSLRRSDALPTPPAPLEIGVTSLRTYARQRCRTVLPFRMIRRIRLQP